MNPSPCGVSSLPLSASLSDWSPLLLAIYAAVYAKAAPAKEDLERVERNTAVTSGHLENVHLSLKAQEERDSLPPRVDALHIGVSGDCIKTDPLPVKVTISDPSVSVTRMELFLRNGKYFGTAQCSKVGDREYAAALVPKQMSDLIFADLGVPHAPKLQITLRVYFVLEGHERYRDCGVTIYEMNVYGIQAKGKFPGWRIEGSV